MEAKAAQKKKRNAPQNKEAQCHTFQRHHKLMNTIKVHITDNNASFKDMLGISDVKI